MFHQTGKQPMVPGTSSTARTTEPAIGKRSRVEELQDARTGGASARESEPKRKRASRLQIVDAASSAKLDGSVPVLAGRPVRLRMSTVEGQLAQPRWTLPASAVGDYALSAQQASTSPVQGLDTPEISFYFTAAGPQTVTIAGDVDGTPESTDIQFQVTKPAFELSARQGQTEIKKHDGILKFQLTGYNSGITVTGKVTTKDDERGVLSIVQLINAHVRHVAALDQIPGGATYDEPGRTPPTSQELALQGNHTHIHEIATTRGWVLDTSYPYARTSIPANTTKAISAKDSPKYPIYPSITKMDFSEQFQVYLMYQPDGGIPTTLGRLDWNHEAGVNDPNAPSPGWYHQIPNAKVQLQGQQTDTLPTWNANAKDLLNTEFQGFTSDPHG
ncbi:MAG TPA: hypothetical protein VFP84_35730 [Kofleriaceae bacterium]|nr:hypothetical protein [Kofleriaceae bacterium]